MYERILVPLDGSELAEMALPYVEEVAKRLNSEVLLLTANALGEDLERLLRPYLEKRAEVLQSLGIEASPLVVHGNAADEILDCAEKSDIDLIIISTHGRTGLVAWAMGSIANKIVQRSRIPTLLIRPGEPETIAAGKELRKILVPLDGSHFAESIIPCVESLAGGMGSEVILLRVVETVRPPYFTIYNEVPGWEKYEQQFMAKAEEEAKRYLNEQEGVLKDRNLKVTSASLSGRPAQTILEYAEDNSVDLIALATHGFSGITKWVYGSVASKIIESSSKPVLLMRPPLPSADA